jgi:ATP-dependent DNA ligase
VIDGEAVSERPNGRRSYNLRSVAGRACCHLIAFDLMCLDGQDLRTTACEARRESLKTILPGDSGVRFSESVDGSDGQVLFEEICRRKLEGIVSKRKSSRYRSGPFDAWRKNECKDYRRD